MSEVFDALNPLAKTADQHLNEVTAIFDKATAKADSAIAAISAQCEKDRTKAQELLTKVEASDVVVNRLQRIKERIQDFVA